MLKPHDPPEGSLEVFIAGMQRVINGHRAFSKTLPEGSIPADASPLEAVGPLPLYEFGADAVQRVGFPHTAVLTGWRYFVFVDGEPRGTATIRLDKGDMKFSRFQTDGFLRQTLEAIGIGEEISDSEAPGLEACLLECRELYFSSVWIKGDPGNETIIPLETLVPGLIDSLSSHPPESIRLVLLERLQAGSGALKPVSDS